MIRLCAFSDEAASDLSGQIEALHSNRIPLMELRNVDGINVKNISAAQAREYEKRLSGEGIGVWALGSPLGKVRLDDDFWGDVRHIFDLAHLFKTKRIRIFSFFDAYAQKSRVEENLSRMVELAKKEELYLCLENEKEIYGDTHTRVTELLDAVKGLRYVYDPANFLQVGDDADTTLNALHARADYFHIKDVIASTEEIVPAGQGDGKIVELIRRIDRDVTLTLEPHLAVFAGYASIDNTQLKNKYAYPDNGAAFRAAAAALKECLHAAGYRETEGGYVRQ